jgi:hypothetical protein
MADSLPGPASVSSAVRTAILSSICEKRFDRVKRTRERADGIIAAHDYPFAEQFRNAKTLADIIGYIKGVNEPEGWFSDWKRLFTKGPGQIFSDKEAEFIESGDSLVGWAAANSARRNNLGESGQKRLRDLYQAVCRDDDNTSLRWRIVHVLGAYDRIENVEFLRKVVREETYPWVQYGAIRALVEIASASDTLQKEILDALASFVEGYAGDNWVRRQIFEEIIETSFINGSAPGWMEGVTPLLTFIGTREQSLQDKVENFAKWREAV